MGISGMVWRSLFEAWMPSSAPQMVLLIFAKTKVRPAAGEFKLSLQNFSYTACLGRKQF